MPFTVKSYASFDKTSPLGPYDVERRDALPDDVVIAITYTGICHSDLHIGHNWFGNTVYPVVPGHEIVGVVESVGDKVTKHKVGDVVAVGCMTSSCGECEQCKLSHEMICAKGMELTYNSPEARFPGHSTAGGYATKIVVTEHFVLKVPKALQDPKLLPGVAPILCAGITTYSPLRQFGIGKGSKVGIAGLGGLGHLGVKLACAVGAEVTVISRSHAKDEHAEELGARRIVASGSEEEMATNAGTLDLIIDTVPFDHDIEPYITLVKPYGAFCMVGYVGELGKKVNTAGLIFGHKKFAGSAIGGIQDTQDLLELCAKEKIVAGYKVIPMEGVNDAWAAMDKGDSANRFIIDIEKFRG